MFDKTIRSGKEILKEITTLGLGVVIGNITSVLMPEVSIPIKARGYIGSYIVSMVISDKTDEYIDVKSEELINGIADIKNSIKNKKGEGA